MKFFVILVYIYFVSIVVAFTQGLTFDDLPTAHGTVAVIPGGYGGVNWNNFVAVDGTSEAPQSGYRTGMVTPNNVIFDSFATPAFVTNVDLFTLSSAYVTAAWVDGLNLEVQGFDGTSLVYDNTYILHTNGPILIDFNYSGVNNIEFIPYIDRIAGTSSQFVMDNLTITVPEPESLTLFLAGILIGIPVISSGRPLKCLRATRDDLFQHRHAMARQASPAVAEDVIHPACLVCAPKLFSRRGGE